MKIPKLNLGRIILGLVVLSILGYFVFQTTLFGLKIKTAWPEVQFALDKNSVVKVLRESYQEKQAKLEKSFLQKQKTAEEKLLEAVAEQIQDGQSK